MRGVALWVAFVVGIVALAGCTESASEPPAQPQESAAEPMADGVTGSISGKVLDEEASPVVRADVALVETAESVFTDAEGSFTFNGVEPGSYRVVVTRLGYESVAKKVDVVPGEVTQLEFSLASVALAVDPWYSSQPYRSFLQADQEWISFVFILAGENWSALCGTCIHEVYLTPEPVSTLAEHWWEETGVPVYNERITAWWRYYDPVGDYHNALESYTNRESRDMGVEGDELLLSKADHLTLSIHSDLDTISVQHRIESWYTFAYVEPLPSGFTALPPE